MKTQQVKVKALYFPTVVTRYLKTAKAFRVYLILKPTRRWSRRWFFFTLYSALAAVENFINFEQKNEKQTEEEADLVFVILTAPGERVESKNQQCCVLNSYCLLLLCTYKSM